jgi:hypothetical protein
VLMCLAVGGLVVRSMTAGLAYDLAGAVPRQFMKHRKLLQRCLIH